MSEEAEEVKRLLSFKKRIEKRIEKLESELKELHSILESVNSVLLAKGFKRAEVIKKPTAKAAPLVEEAVQPTPAPTLKPETAPAPEFKEVIPLKTSSGELLANLYVRDNFLRVVLAEDKNFNVNTPPFNQFLVERVLAKCNKRTANWLRLGSLNRNKCSPTTSSETATSSGKST
jgi:hypothetical protein